MNNEGLRIIENVTTLPGLQWVESPMDTTNSLRLQLPEPGNYSGFMEPRSDGKGHKLSQAGRALVDANWASFRNMGGMADSWDEIRKDPDQIGQRIEGLERSRGILFESLREASLDNPEAQRLLGLMERSFKARTEGMRTTRLNAEIEAGNSPWREIIEETADRFVNGHDNNPHLKRGAALSHIQAKRRRIEEFANKIIDTDDRFSTSDCGRLRTHIENKYVDRAKVGFSTILPGNMKGLGIDGLDSTVERASATQVGTSLDISDFYTQCAEEFLVDNGQNSIAKVDASHIEAPKRRQLSGSGKLALVSVGAVILGTILIKTFNGDGQTPITDFQRNMDSRNNGSAYVADNSAFTTFENTLPAAVPFETPFPTPAFDTEIVEENNRQEIITTPKTTQDETLDMEVMDDAGEVDESLNDGLFEIDGIDFSQDYQIVIPREWSQYIGVSDQDHILSLNGDGHEKNTAMTEVDFSYDSDDTKATMVALSSAMGKNFVIQGHSYVVDSLLNKPEESDKKIEEYPFEPIRRIVEYILSTGQIPEDVLNSPITILQNGREVRFQVVNAQKLPVTNFSTMNYYSDPTLPATYQLGPDKLDLTGEGSVGTGKDVAQQDTIHLVTCTGSQEFITDPYGETYFTFDEQAVLTLQLVEDESQNEQAIEGLPPVDEVVLSPTFASEFGTNFQMQPLSQLASARPELVRAYAPGTNSRKFIDHLFANYEPAKIELSNFIETNNLQNVSPEEQLMAFLYTQKVATGESIDTYLRTGRFGSHGSTFGVMTSSTATDGTWPTYTGIMYRTDEAVDPIVPVDETFQLVLNNELVSKNEDAWRKWGYNEDSILTAIDSSNARALLEFIEKFYMAKNGFIDMSYEFSVNGVKTSSPVEAGNELAEQLTTLLGREVTSEELESLVNRDNFNKLMDELRARGIELEALIGLARDGENPLSIEASFPPVVASTTN